MITKAQRLANLTYSIIARSCHKIIIRKSFWKNGCLPSVLYETNILNLTGKKKEVQVIENSVYRQILGAPNYAH